MPFGVILALAITYSNDFIRKVSQAYDSEVMKAQELNQSFPFRLIERQKSGIHEVNEELTARINRVAEKRQRLKMAGILAENNAEDNNKTFAVDKNLADSTGAVMSVYTEDEEQKLAVFDELLQQAELFLQIINSCLVNKKLKLNGENGFEIINSYDGESSPLITLSSGEQQEINLFYKLIFLTEHESFVLIDEPELSLHIGWQLRFVDDLKKVRQLNGCDFLLATHSPAIISNHWDYVVELEV